MHPAKQPTSIKEVARLAGVSVGTVSNVLNQPEKVAPATVARVARAVEEVGFVRNDVARQLRVGHTSSIGLVVLDVRNPFFTEVARGAEEEASRHRLSVILGNSGEDASREAHYLDLFSEQRVRGVLISPIGDVTEKLLRLREHGTPAVLVDRSSHSSDLSSVTVNDVGGGLLAGRHLIELGKRRIAFVGGPIGIRQVRDRLTGIELATNEVPDARIEVHLGRSLSVQEGRRIGEHLASMPAGSRPDSVFAVNDLMALGVLQALVMLGSIRVPEDIALIGYDDIEFASGAIVPLTSIRQPAVEIGRAAVEILLDEVLHDATPGRTVVFQPELVIRASTQSR